MTLGRGKLYVALCLCCIVPLLFIFSITSRTDQSLLNTHLHWMASVSDHSNRQAFVVDTPGCKIPNIDPFDVSIRHLVAADNFTIHCNASPPITYTEGHFLRINRTALSLHYKDDLDYCEYQTIYRPTHKPLSDDRFAYQRPAHQFNDDVDLSKTRTEFLRVACYGRHTGMLLYTNFHAVILRKPDVDSRCEDGLKRFVENTKPKEMFNVLLLGMDSISRLNFARNMQRTHQFLLAELHAFELFGFNKVADNTYVNLVPMFAGQYVEELPWDERLSDVPFDNYTFIWNQFSQRGYRTLYAEDAPKIAIFNYLKAGFHRPPADYYLRPFSLAVEDHGSVWNSNHDCIAGRLETQVVLDWITQFEQEFRHEPHLSFAFITRLTHEEVHKAAAADEPYLQFLQQLHKEHLLNRTIIFFYSDHGMRFGDLRQTYVGKMEERLPFAYLVVPPAFQSSYPDLVDSLRVNTHRLTTPFDIYETLLDVMDFDGVKPAPNSVAHRGCTLFSEIPLERTCKSAAILPHWCCCHQMVAMPTKDPTVLTVANSVVRYINEAISIHGGRCAELRLNNVIDARRILPGDDVMRFRESLHDVIGRTVKFDDDVTAARFVEYQLTVETQPGGAVFEATVRHHIKMAVSSSHVAAISRINVYGDQSVCINLHSHKKFCFCV